MNRIVPKNKFDDEACKNLIKASDSEVIPFLKPLLECLQDLNWPIAGPVSDRLEVIGTELVEPLLEILEGNDEIWKYWIISHFLYRVTDEVYKQVIFKLNSMKKNPTKTEINEEVHDAVCELLATRK